MNKDILVGRCKICGKVLAVCWAEGNSSEYMKEKAINYISRGFGVNWEDTAEFQKNQDSCDGCNRFGVEMENELNRLGIKRLKVGEHCWDTDRELRTRCKLSLTLMPTEGKYLCFTCGKNPLAVGTLLPDGKTLDITIFADRVGEIIKNKS